MSFVDTWLVTNIADCHVENVRIFLQKNRQMIQSLTILLNTLVNVFRVEKGHNIL